MEIINYVNLTVIYVRKPIIILLKTVKCIEKL